MSMLGNLPALLERFGEPAALAGGGLALGLLFGAFAQRSRFCLRSAVIEFARGRWGEKLAVWLLAFSAAVVGVQAMALAGLLDVGSARQIAGPGSLSGALVGGLVFGLGMVMARGCPSRLIVLTGSGNLRSLLSGLVFAVAAQSTIGGALAPLRSAVAGWWTIDAGASRDLLAATGLGSGGGLAIGLAGLALASWLGLRARMNSAASWLGGLGVGLVVAAAWGFTQWVARNSFEPLQAHGVNFSGPSAEWLMRVLQSPAPRIGFEFGLVPGVLVGAWAASLLGRDLRLEGFHDGPSMPRYLTGAILMGFGAVLGGGCAVGAGLSGGAVFALTAWVALAGMWLSASIADRLLDAPGAARAEALAMAATGLR